VDVQDKNHKKIYKGTILTEWTLKKALTS